MIATARIAMPKARVRLSAGRSSLSQEAQVLCMTAGANSIFYGDKLLTTPNAESDEDDALFAALAPRQPAGCFGLAVDVFAVMPTHYKPSWLRSRRGRRLEPRGFQKATFVDRLVVRDALRAPHHEATG